MLSAGKGTQTRHARNGVAAQPLLAFLCEDKTVELPSQKYRRNKQKHHCNRKKTLAI